jgi:hypothetical protein
VSFRVHTFLRQNICGEEEGLLIVLGLSQQWYERAGTGTYSFGGFLLTGISMG